MPMGNETFANKGPRVVELLDAQNPVQIHSKLEGTLYSMIFQSYHLQPQHFPAVS